MVAEGSDTDSWRDWSKYVIKELERLSKRDDIQEEKITDVRILLQKLDTQLKERGAFWGALAGFAAAFAIELLLFFVKQFF